MIEKIDETNADLDEKSFEKLCDSATRIDEEYIKKRFGVTQQNIDSLAKIPHSELRILAIKYIKLSGEKSDKLSRYYRGLALICAKIINLYDDPAIPILSEEESRTRRADLLDSLNKIQFDSPRYLGQPQSYEPPNTSRGGGAQTFNESGEIIRDMK